MKKENNLPLTSSEELLKVVAHYDELIATFGRGKNLKDYAESSEILKLLASRERVFISYVYCSFMEKTEILGVSREVAEKSAFKNVKEMTEELENASPEELVFQYCDRLLSRYRNEEHERKVKELVEKVRPRSPITEEILRLHKFNK